MAELNPAAPAEPTPPPAAAAPPEPKLTPGQKLAAAAPPPVVEPTEPEVTPEPPALSPKAQKLVDAGFANVKDDDEAFDRLLAAYQNTKNEFGAQLQAALSEIQQTQPTPTKAQDARGTPPESQTGKWTWTPPPIDPTLPEAQVQAAREARQRYFDAFVTKFVSDPAAALDPLLEDKVSALLEQRLHQITSQQQQQSFEQKLFTDNPWLFEADPVSGKPTGNALSAEGKLIDQYMREAQERGADYQLSWDYALTKHRAGKAEFAAKQATTTLSAEQINEQKKREMLTRAVPSRAGSVPQPAAPNQTQNKHLSFGERFRQNAERNGVPLNPVA